MQDESGKAAAGSPAVVSATTAQVGTEVYFSGSSCVFKSNIPPCVGVRPILDLESNVGPLYERFNVTFRCSQGCSGGGRKGKMSLDEAV